VDYQFQQRSVVASLYSEVRQAIGSVKEQYLPSMVQLSMLAPDFDSLRQQVLHP
jgi:hypothetical protein